MLTKESLFDGVIPEPNSGCWLWCGPVDAWGYGKHKNKGVHRTSYELFCGEIPKDMFILHSCDQPSCVNPVHLRVGTAAENTADSTRRGRRAPQDCDKNNSAKLTWDDVNTIRSDPRSNLDIAAAYGLSKWHVSRIRRHVYWPVAA